MLRVLVSTFFVEASPAYDSASAKVFETKGAHITDQIPKTISTVSERFNLQGKLTLYAVCTTCKYTHKPTYRHGDKEKKSPIYPKMCTNIPSPGGGHCGTLLLERVYVGGIHVWRPTLIFAYHSVFDYVAMMDSQVNLREAMDQACDNAMSSISSAEPVEMNDVFSGSFVRSFEGPDKKLFIDRPRDEGRLLFSLNLDFYTTEGMLIRGAKSSSGIIAMACLNLPVDIRYKAQNMYIAGIIPGPVEPHLTQSNHFIRPLMEDLEVAWRRGILYTHAPGRLMRMALACAVCDLPGARKLSCMAGVSSHHICTACVCRGKGSYETLDLHNWHARNADDLREAAEAWRNAPSNRVRKNIFREHGVRWSELWRLPYWDPSRQLVVDPMHCLLEGIVQDHFRYTLGLTSEEAKVVDAPRAAFLYDFPQVPDKKTDPTHPLFNKESALYLKDNEIPQVAKIHGILQQPLENMDDDLEALAKS